jgi:hypothetical protein
MVAAILCTWVRLLFALAAAGRGMADHRCFQHNVFDTIIGAVM